MKGIAILITLISIFVGHQGFSQSNIRTYTPSKLLKKGQVDVKWFNNFYDERRSTFIPSGSLKPRENFYTSTFEVFTGVSQNRRFNVGLVLNIKSNNVGGKALFSPLEFSNKTGVSRAGVGSIAPSISFQPFESVGNLSVRTSVSIPLFERESENGVYLDKKSYVWENKIFYDRTFYGGNLQLFTELDTQLNLGDEASYDDNGTSLAGGFANNSLGLPLSAFLSYFPTNSFTVFVQAQQYALIDLGNDFSQEYTQLGIGIKFQATSTINLEASYTNFVRGSDTGLGQTINFGLRFLSKAY